MTIRIPEYPNFDTKVEESPMDEEKDVDISSLGTPNISGNNSQQVIFYLMRGHLYLKEAELIHGKMIGE